MEGISTRDAALGVALELFSRKGYQAVSMTDIADALHIKAPSLYKHFKGKEELYTALFPYLEGHYKALWEAAGEHQRWLAEQMQTDRLLRLEQLETETMAWLRPEVEDPEAADFRRLMATCQFQRNFLDRWLWDTPVSMYQDLFAVLIDLGVLRRGEPRVMAAEYLAPLVQLLARLDRAAPSVTVDWQAEAAAHIRQFHRIFARREDRAPQGGVGRLFRR